MNPWRVAEEFRVFAAADEEVIAAGVHCVNELTGGKGNTVQFPRLVFSARVKPLGRSSQVGVADVMVSVESHSQDVEVSATAGEVHDRILQLVRRKFHGSSDATGAAERAAVAAAITGRGYLDVDPRVTPMAGDPSIEGQRFRTVVAIKCGVCFVPVVVALPTLAVTPGGIMVAAGAAGGPFSPSKVFTLTNGGVVDLAWTVTVDVPWLTVSVASGVLAEGAHVTVTISVNAAADELAETAFLGTITFRNVTGYQTFTRGVALVVGLTGGDSMVRKTGTFTIPHGTQTFDIPFPEAFDDVPFVGELFVEPPDGLSAIGVHSRVADAEKVTVVLDTVTPESGALYTVDWFAFLP